MKIHKKIILIFILFLFFDTKGQQTIQLSQYVFNPLIINPAYTGYRDGLYLNGLYRTQWVGFEGAPKSTSFSIDAPLSNSDKNIFSLGATYLNEKIGAQETNQFSGSVSYKMKIGNKIKNNNLVLGLSLGTINYNINSSSFVALNPNDPILNFNSLNTFKPDAGLGLYYFSRKIYIGLSFLNLLNNNIISDLNINNVNYASINRNRHMYLNFGGNINLNDNFTLKPFIMFKEDFKSIADIDITALLDYKHIFWFGIAYQFGLNINKPNSYNVNLYNTEQISTILQFYINNNLRIGYSYDYMLNGLSNYQQGSHEISLGVYLNSKNKFTKIQGTRFF